MRRHAYSYKVNFHIVSTHAPIKDATKMEGRRPRVVSFNPRTHKGCDSPSRCILSVPESVSTHAPIKDATQIIVKSVTFGAVSTHAPIKDATTIRSRGCCLRQVSTHAPIKDATGIILNCRIFDKFQPTHP